MSTTRFQKHALCMAATLLALAAAVGAQADELVAKPYRTGDEKRVDNPVDACLIAYSGLAGKPVKGPADAPYAGFGGGEGIYLPRYDILDAVDRKHGNFSIVFKVTDPGKETAFGFFPGPYIHHWELTGEFALHFWAKADGQPAGGGWAVTLYDVSGKRLHHALGKSVIDGQWREFTLPLKAFEGGAGFNFSGIQSVQIEADLPAGASLRLDDLCFTKDGNPDDAAILGVSDKTITQYMAEESATRPKRAEEVFTGKVTTDGLIRLYWQGKKEEGNKAALQFVEEWTKSGGVFNLLEGRTLPILYLAFSSKGRLKPGMMSAEAEKAVLNTIWLNTELANDIGHARRSPWHIVASENHDYGLRLRGLLSSQIFKEEANYRDRVYPNLGGSLFARRRKAAALAAGSGKGDRYNPEDASKLVAWYDRIAPGEQKLCPEDHYQAWVKSWKEFFAERARYGFGNEYNATYYSSSNIPPSLEVYAWAEDAELCLQARMFQDLIWAQWFQDSVLMFQGGAATRGGPGGGTTGRIAEFLLGGPATGGGRNQSWRYALSDYQLPRIVWEMALADRTVKGEYAFVSRKPNEDRDLSDRPAGTEDAMLLRPDSRLVRYSWVTPDYVMGLRMDHPRALYSHIFVSGQGIVFPTTPDALIEFHPGGSYLAVQDRNVAILQTKWSSNVQTMPMHTYGPPGGPEVPTKVWFGKDIDRIAEKDGWVFAQEGDAYVAFRFASAVSGKSDVCDKDGLWLLEAAKDNYTWQENATSILRTRQSGGRMLIAKEPYVPLIVEASRKAHHATLEVFQADVLDNPLVLKAVEPGPRFLLTYQGCGKDARELAMNCISQQAPRIGDKYVDYNCPAFDSPFLNGATGSGVVALTGPVSGKKLVLDFNKIERQEP